MAHLDDLISQVKDDRLRRDMEQALATLKRKQKFGLVYEEHLPEHTALFGLPIRPGDLVQRRDDPKGKARYTVLNVDGDTITVEPEDGGDCATMDADDLLTLKRFGEPIYPALTPLGHVDNGPADKPHHAVINAENYHALQALQYVYEGQVDCIYIDPPYNTGARDWKYNNNYVDGNDAWRHSKWLSMMERRLRLAKRLLKRDGVLIVTIDENEHANLVLLMSQEMPSYSINSISIVHNPRGVQGDNFSFTHEYAVYAVPAGMKRIADRPLTSEEIQTNSATLRNWGGESERHHGKTTFFPILIRDSEIVEFGDVAADGFHPGASNVDLSDGTIEVWPVDSKGVERKWRYARGSVESIADKLFVKRGRNGVVDVHLAKTEATYKTVWVDPKLDASTHGTRVVSAFTGISFPFPKSVYAVQECLASVLADRPEALIVDFFAGSGTTFHATALLNAEDDGKRRCLLVTNNEVEDTTSKRLAKDERYKGDPEYEALGIFEHVTRPRVEAVVTGKRPDGKPVPGTDINSRPFSEGFPENVAFYRLDYLDPDEVSLGRQFDAILPMLWLAAGGIGEPAFGAADGDYSIPEGSTYAVLFREDRYRAFAAALAERTDVTHVWIVTDSQAAYAEIRSSLPRDLRVGMLYRDYLRNFRINTR